MLKKILILCGFLLIIICLISNDKEELRVRIIPKSNDETSLIIKEEVKEIVIIFLKETYDSVYNKFLEEIRLNINSLNEKLSYYNAKASLENVSYYNKKIDGKLIKDNEVYSLLVEIEEALGDNWWGVIYPRFLEIESSDKVEYESYFIKKIKEWFN